MKTQRKKLLTIAIFTLWLLSAVQAGIVNKIDAAINQSSQKSVQFSVCVIKADSGRIVYSHNANQPMLPASNMKVITTAAALDILGPDFQYVTQIGLYKDSLFVKASGD